MAVQSNIIHGGIGQSTSGVTDPGGNSKWDPGTTLGKMLRETEKVFGEC